MNNNIYFCIKDQNNTFIPFFSVQGSFFSKKDDNEIGGSSHISLDEIIQNIHYKEFLEEEKNKDTPSPIKLLEKNNENIIEPEQTNINIINNDDDINEQKESGGSSVSFEKSDKNNFESALPDNYIEYLNNKLKNKQ